jgi:hypothetical protein
MTDDPLLALGIDLNKLLELDYIEAIDEDENGLIRYRVTESGRQYLIDEGLIEP